MRTILALIAILVAIPAAAENCAKFEEPLAYNACLARQGPAARAAHVGPAPAGIRAPATARRTYVRAAPRFHGRFVATRRRGRSELVFSPHK